MPAEKLLDFNKNYEYIYYMIFINPTNKMNMIEHEFLVGHNIGE